jgi:hypothetical protein
MWSLRKMEVSWTDREKMKIITKLQDGREHHKWHKSKEGQMGWSQVS